jgi:hypothetical protein
MRARKMGKRQEAFSKRRRDCLGLLRAPQSNFPPPLPCPLGQRLTDCGRDGLSNRREDDRGGFWLREATFVKWRPLSLIEKRIEYNAQQARIAE